MVVIAFDCCGFSSCPARWIADMIFGHLLRNVVAHCTSTLNGGSFASLNRNSMAWFTSSGPAGAFEIALAPRER